MANEETIPALLPHFNRLLLDSTKRGEVAIPATPEGQQSPCITISHCTGQFIIDHYIPNGTRNSIN